MPFAKLWQSLTRLETPDIEHIRVARWQSGLRRRLLWRFHGKAKHRQDFQTLDTRVGNKPIAEEAIEQEKEVKAGWSELLGGAVGGLGTDVTTLLVNSTLMALGIAVGKIAISVLAAYAIVFFAFPLRRLCFWLIFITLMLPVEFQQILCSNPLCIFI